VTRARSVVLDMAYFTAREDKPLITAGNRSGERMLVYSRSKAVVFPTSATLLVEGLRSERGGSTQRVHRRRQQGELVEDAARSAHTRGCAVRPVCRYCAGLAADVDYCRVAATVWRGSVNVHGGAGQGIRESHF
jgi:hypothetical protein